MLLVGVFILVNGFNRLNGLMIKYLTACLSKSFEEVNYGDP